MGRTLAQIFKDADAIIEKTAGVTAQDSHNDFSVSTEDEDIFKLAEAVRCSGRNKEASFKGFSYAEKIAYSKAILSTMLEAEKLSKLAAFEKQAEENGLSDQAEVLIKKATAKCFVDGLLEKSMPKDASI